MADISNIEQTFLDFIESGDFSNYTLRNNLKKTYSNYRKERRLNETLSIQNLNKIKNIILNNYDKLKDITEINEILELIIEDYNYLKDEQNQSLIEEIIKSIYTYSLGHSGAKSSGLSFEEVEEIIKRKINDADEVLVNRDDILNILKEQFDTAVVGSYDKYQKLIEDVVMVSIEDDIENVTNPKAISILKDLAKSYKLQGKYDKSKEIYEKCLELYKKIGKDSKAIEFEFAKVFEEDNKKAEKDSNSEESELQNELDNVSNLSQQFNTVFTGIGEDTNLTKLFLSLKNIRNVEDIVRGLSGQIETEEVEKEISDYVIPRSNKPEPKDEENRNNYVMPVPEKIEGLQTAIKDLKLTISRIVKFRDVDENSNSEILRELKEKLSNYSEFILIELKELNVSLLECLSKTQRYLQIIPNEHLYEILKFDTVRQQRINGAINKKHMKESFAKNLTKTLRSILASRENKEPINTEELNEQVEVTPDEEKQEESVSERRENLRKRLKKLIDKITELTEAYIQTKANNSEKERIMKELEETLAQKQKIQTELNELKNQFDAIPDVEPDSAEDEQDSIDEK